MCGIAGFIDLWEGARARHEEERARILDAMCRVITHRGPDDQGVMLTQGVALGMRRLSIIDLAGGHQPISGEDSSVSVVFNGGIYNFCELQPELESLGHRFPTHSYTPTIAHSSDPFSPAFLH